MLLSNDALQPQSLPHIIPDNSSLATRNPTRDVLPKCTRVQSKHSHAEITTANARHNLNKANAVSLQCEIEEFFKLHDGEISRLAKTYHKSEANIKMLLTSGSKYQNRHAPSLRNALVHAKGLRMNEGK